MSGIHCLVFSKDRAMQLDAFLRSAERYAPYETITVLEHPTPGHDEAYAWCEEEHPGPWAYDNVQARFEELVREWLTACERVVFHTDDDVFFQRAWLPPDHWQAVHSLRLGVNTTYCHPLANQQPLPEPPLDTQLLWRWRDADGDFGYPLCLNGTVYRSQDLLPLMGFPFDNPTELEAGLDFRKELFRPEWMTAPLHSCCVSLPHNRVSSSSGCRTGANPDWQPDALRERYLAGDRIDLDAMDFSNVIGAHQEVPLAFARREG